MTTPQPKFEDFPLSADALEALRRMGYATPTPVQAATLPPLLAGRDVVGEAPTGTGKTAAFGLALVERTPTEEPHVALVLVPTRELATQVAAEISALGAPRAYAAFAVTGGIREGFLLDRMGRAQCIVATPGRLLDLLDKDEMTLAGIRAVVVDEADRMMDEGFLPEVRRILELAPANRQTMLFSATLPSEIMALAEDFFSDAELVRVGEGAAAGAVAHYRLNVRDGEKTDTLESLLRSHEFDRALVFMRSRANVDATTRELRARGIQVDPLHGERTPFERRHVMDLFRRGATRIVLATDVAARGIDVPEIDLVVNFDLPPNADTYVHRGGRTGRMGRSGAVVTFVTPDEKPDRVDIERRVGIELEPYRLEVQHREAPLAKKVKKPRRRKAKPTDEDKPPKQRDLPSRESVARRAKRLGREPEPDRLRRRPKE